MPWNGAGTYNLPPAYSPEVNGTTIDANRYNGLTGDVAAGVTAAIAKNGENAATANLPMGGFKHTGAAVASASGQYLVWGQASLEIATGSITSGTFGGPVVTAVTNCDTPVPGKAFYSKVGAVVTYSGLSQVNSLAGGLVIFEVALPVVSNLAVGDLSGTVNPVTGSATATQASVSLNAATDRLLISFVAGAIATYSFKYVVMYEILP